MDSWGDLDLALDLDTDTNTDLHRGTDGAADNDGALGWALGLDSAAALDGGLDPFGIGLRAPPRALAPAADAGAPLDVPAVVQAASQALHAACDAACACQEPVAVTAASRVLSTSMAAGAAAAAAERRQLETRRQHLAHAMAGLLKAIPASFSRLRDGILAAVSSEDRSVGQALERTRGEERTLARALGPLQQLHGWVTDDVRATLSTTRRVGDQHVEGARRQLEAVKAEDARNMGTLLAAWAGVVASYQRVLGKAAEAVAALRAEDGSMAAACDHAAYILDAIGRVLQDAFVGAGASSDPADCLFALSSLRHAITSSEASVAELLAVSAESAADSEGCTPDRQQELERTYEEARKELDAARAAVDAATADAAHTSVQYEDLVRGRGAGEHSTGVEAHVRLQTLQREHARRQVAAEARLASASRILAVMDTEMAAVRKRRVLARLGAATSQLRVWLQQCKRLKATCDRASAMLARKYDAAYRQQHVARLATDTHCDAIAAAFRRRLAAVAEAYVGTLAHRLAALHEDVRTWLAEAEVRVQREFKYMEDTAGFHYGIGQVAVGGAVDHDVRMHVAGLAAQSASIFADIAACNRALVVNAERYLHAQVLRACAAVAGPL